MKEVIEMNEEQFEAFEAKLDEGMSEKTKEFLSRTKSWDSNKQLLIFSASWCSGCQSLKKMLSSNGISYTEIDIDKEPEKAQDFGVRSLPTSIIIDSDASDCIVIVGVKLQEIIKGME